MERSSRYLIINHPYATVLFRETGMICVCILSMIAIVFALVCYLCDGFAVTPVGLVQRVD